MTLSHQPAAKASKSSATSARPRGEALHPPQTDLAPVAPSCGHDFGAVAIHAVSPLRLQPKLAINQPGDIYEQEADRVAEQVMRMPDPTKQPPPHLAAEKSSSPTLHRKCACGGTPGPTGECESCRKKREAGVQRKAFGAGSKSQHATVPPIVNEVLRSPGQPLDPATRAFMEPRFGYDFSKVRVHDDTIAAESARAINAAAYTVGSQLVFGANRCATHTLEGRKLMAHELTHVVQQGGVKIGSEMQVVPATHQSEQEAASISERVSGGAHAVPISAAPTAGLQRLAGPEAPISISPQAIQKLQVLLREYTAFSESGAVTAAEAAEVTAAVTEAEVALATATEVAAAGGTAISIGETTLVASGALAADDVTGIGVADDVAIPFLLVGALVAFGVGYLIGSSADKIAATAKNAASAVDRAIETLKKAVERAKSKTKTEPKTETQTTPQAKTETKRRSRSCRTNEPCETPLPIAWPTELPRPEEISPRTLKRTSKGELEWEGVERGDVQSSYAAELRQYRQRNLPLPHGVTCFGEDAEPNTPLDAHHIHPMYLNGEDAHWNLCGLETLRHLRGHARLDDQTFFLPVYKECGICTPFLKAHPNGQEYIIVAGK